MSLITSMAINWPCFSRLVFPRHSN